MAALLQRSTSCPREVECCCSSELQWHALPAVAGQIKCGQGQGSTTVGTRGKWQWTDGRLFLPRLTEGHPRPSAHEGTSDLILRVRLPILMEWCELVGRLQLLKSLARSRGLVVEFLVVHLSKQPFPRMTERPPKGGPSYLSWTLRFPRLPCSALSQLGPG